LSGKPLSETRQAGEHCSMSKVRSRTKITHLTEAKLKQGLAEDVEFVRECA